MNRTMPGTKISSRWAARCARARTPRKGFERFWKSASRSGKRSSLSKDSEAAERLAEVPSAGRSAVGRCGSRAARANRWEPHEAQGKISPAPRAEGKRGEARAGLRGPPPACLAGAGERLAQCGYVLRQHA